MTASSTRPPHPPAPRLAGWPAPGDGDLGTPGRPRRDRTGGVHAPVGARPDRGRLLAAAAATTASAPCGRCAPGLGLATVPSLLAMLDDPTSLRALLLGARLPRPGAGRRRACAGALRWSSAPLVGGRARPPRARAVRRGAAVLARDRPVRAPCCWSSASPGRAGCATCGPRYAVRRRACADALRPARSAGEHRLHDLARRVDARLHGADRDVEQRGDVGVVELLEVAQQRAARRAPDGRRPGAPAPRGSRAGCPRSRSWCAGPRPSGSSSVGSSAERRFRLRYVERALLEATACSQVVKRLRPAKVWMRVVTSSSASCAASSASSG